MENENSVRLTVGRALVAALFLAMAFATWRFLLAPSVETDFSFRIVGVLLAFSLIGAAVGHLVGRTIGYALVALGVGVFLVAGTYWTFPRQD